MKIIIVGGTWDRGGGKASKVVESLVQGVKDTDLFPDSDVADGIEVFNGGGMFFEMENDDEAPSMEGLLGDIMEVSQDNKESVDVIVWMPNVSNEEAKAREVKKYFPHCVLVSSKRNLEGKYDFSEIVAHGLSMRSQLILEVLPSGNHFAVVLEDTLGNVWYAGTDWHECGRILAHRTAFLVGMTRQGSVQSPEAPVPAFYAARSKREMGYLDSFIKVIQDSGQLFHELINPAKGTKRFLGNASFRCENGFPSVSVGGNTYVSRRNVNKEKFDSSKFVQVGLNNKTGALWYRGEHKPSVDTPIQLRLYTMLRHVHCMLHSHVYVKDAPTTRRVVACGSLEEVDEIMTVVKKEGLAENYHFAINLKGHGSILFMSDPDEYYEYREFFVRRPWPEQQPTFRDLLRKKGA